MEGKMSIDYYENEILDLSRNFKEAREMKDEFLKEARMQYIGAVLRMLESSVETSRMLRGYTQDKRSAG